MKNYLVGTDGSSLRNGKNYSPSGWAYVFNNEAWKAGGLLRGTNQVAELLAVLMLLRDHPEKHLTIQTDSAYVIGCCTTWKKSWQRNNYHNREGKQVSNLNIVIPIHHLLDNSSNKIEFVKVPGHDKQHRFPLNDLADKYAKKAANEAHRTGGEVLLQGP